MNNLYKTEKEVSVSVRPQYKVLEQDKQWELRVWLPGVSKEGITLQTEKHNLILKASKEAIPSSWEALYAETKRDSYELKLELGREIDSSKIRANFKNGVLVLGLEKAESFKHRVINIE